MSVCWKLERPELTSQFYQVDVLTLTAPDAFFFFFYSLYWTRSFRCHQKWRGRMPSKRSTRFGVRPGWRQRVASTSHRTRHRDEEHTPARSHHFGVGCWDVGPSLRKVPEGSSTSSCKGSQEDAAMAHQKFFKMSAGIKQRWFYFKNAERPWLRFFFHNVVCKVRGSLQDDGCRRGCCDGREPQTFSMARFLGVHGLEQRCRFLGQVSPYWAWMFAVLLERICA